MEIQNSSPEPKRHVVDIGPHVYDIERAAVEDAVVDGRIITIPDYTRDVLYRFLLIREYCRQNDMPLYRPVDIADAIISGEIKIGNAHEAALLP